MNRVEIKEWSKEKIKGNLWNILVGLLIMMAVSFVFSFGLGFIQAIFGNDSFITSIVSIVVEVLLIPLGIGLYSYLVEFINNDNFDKNLLFEPYERTVNVIGASLLVSLLVMVGCICFIIPGIYLAFSYAMVPYLLATRKDLTVTETLELSRKMMNGHKFDYFVLSISFVGWAILVPFTLGILLIWLYPYMMTATTKFFMDIDQKYTED
mgnify:CR=1 FL=1